MRLLVFCTHCAKVRNRNLSSFVDAFSDILYSEKKSLTNSLSKGRVESSLPVSWKTQLENEQTPPDRRPGGAIACGGSQSPLLHKEHWCAVAELHHWLCFIYKITRLHKSLLKTASAVILWGEWLSQAPSLLMCVVAPPRRDDDHYHVN